MQAEKHILYYNRLNGKRISTKALKAFHHSLKLDIDAKRINTKVPYGVKLINIEKRISKALASAGKNDRFLIELKPVKLNKQKKQVKRKVVIESNELGFADVYGLEFGLPKGEKKELKGLGFTHDGQAKIYSMITDMVLKVMQNEKELPWRKPWAIDSILATNLVSGKPYRGTNLFMLNLIAPMLFGKTGPYWLTYKQAKDLGGNVKKGASGFPVIYYSVYYSVQQPTKKTITESEYEGMSDTEKEKRGARKLFTINYYNVFAQEDIEGIEFPTHENKRVDADVIESAENIVSGMPKAPKIINHKIGRAFYSPSEDHIKLPGLDYFKSDQEYYSTLFHELVHSTGHKKRLNRFQSNKESAEGKDDYAFEELIAELGASYLNAEAGILYFTLKNSASYLKGWQSKLEDIMKGDNKFFIRASAKAAQAADFILNKPATENPLSGLKSAKGKTSSKPLVKTLNGFVSADKTPKQSANTFTLSGVIGLLLGLLQRFKLQIIISGETHSSKSQLGMQIANAFAAIGDTVAWVDWEQGGLDSKDTQASINRNVDASNKSRIHVSAEVNRSVDALKKLAKTYKVIAVDSGTKVKEVSNAWLDELREECPNTVWIIMMQQNEKGGTRGGASAEFDAPVVLKTYRPDHTTNESNYAVVFKNRGNRTGLLYNINKKEIIPTKS